MSTEIDTRAYGQVIYYNRRVRVNDWVKDGLFNKYC